MIAVYGVAAVMAFFAILGTVATKLVQRWDRDAKLKESHPKTK
jgi:hypothetical protein